MFLTSCMVHRPTTAATGARSGYTYSNITLKKEKKLIPGLLKPFLIPSNGDNFETNFLIFKVRNHAQEIKIWLNQANIT